MQNPTLRPHVVSVLSLEARKKIKLVTSRKHDSILQMKIKDSIEHFSWDRVWSEIESYCPLLASFLEGCLPPRLQNNNSSIPSLCVCASIVLKIQNSHVNLVQGPLGISLKNEMKVSDMVDILGDHHQYVPSSSAMEAVTITNEEESEYIRLDSLHTILYFGDQLTLGAYVWCTGCTIKLRKWNTAT